MQRRQEVDLKGAPAGPVEIVLAADQNFLPFCAATMASVLANSADEDQLTFHVLTDAELSEADSRHFDALRSIRGFKMNVIVVDASRFERVRTTPGISIATYYRLMIPDLLPRHVEKVLYLDCDLAVVDRVRALFDIDISDKLFLGIEDSVSRLYNDKFSIPDDAPHVNGGVLLINVEKLREFDFAGVVAEYVERHKYVIELGDQQILNCLFHDQIALAHPRWNAHGSMFEPRWRLQYVGVRNHYTQAEVEEATSQPAIIHYTYHRKPWQSPDHPKSDVYLKYLAMTKYASRFDSVLSSEAKQHDRLRRASVLAARSAWALVERAGGAQLVRGAKRLGRTFSRSVAKSSGVSGRVATLFHRSGLSVEAAGDQWMRRIQEQASAEPRDLAAFVAQNEFAHFVGNGSVSDINGGELQNYKILLRTNHVGLPTDADWQDCDALYLCRWRSHDAKQLEILQHAAQFGKPLFLIETAFFAGCVTWANRKARAEFRRPFGFIVDDMAYYYDATRPSRIRNLLADSNHRLSKAQRTRARKLIDSIVARKITKYNFMPAQPKTKLPFREGRSAVLVVDQTFGDASIQLGRASESSFRRMLEAAVEENPEADIIVKTHPDSLFEQTGRRGYLQTVPLRANVHRVTDSLNPHSLIERCEKVYVVSSQLGFEALLHGKNVVCFGAPFYAGLGLTDDRGLVSASPVERSIEELFHIACIEMSHYVDPRKGTACSMEDALAYAVELRERYLAAGEETA